MQASYLAKPLNPTQAKIIINEIVELLTPKLQEFDAIAFCGSSGLLIGPSVAMALDKGMILVRKEAPDTVHHSPYQVEGDSSAKTYIIVDDLVCTGNTIEKMKNLVHTDLPNSPRFVGTVVYLPTPRIYEWEYEWE